MGEETIVDGTTIVDEATDDGRSEMRSKDHGIRDGNYYKQRQGKETAKGNTVQH